ncbi:hypothetical protein MVEN_02188400 [Mycena venus]|uniref:Uncharacterized protein n=1 Tax=Mycena venus TaxID=2733690 RepID=A0A8H6X976_9AGAR|nr:hypothetical protein MVEN_02188400 [Mycena venus]
MTSKPKRKATTTKKAKQAAKIAAAESKEDAAKPRKRGRPPKNRSPVPQPLKDDADDSEEDTPEDGKEGGVDIDWTVELTWTLVTGMEEDEDIRRGLFPPPGSSKRNNGLPKKHYQWLLAKTCFENRPQYGVAFAKALTGPAKQQKVWWRKIKNRIKVLTDKTRAQLEMMGQTGAGLESADDILPGTAIQTKWDEIREESPWFWEMRSLIGERPNLRPVGIGNNSDDMDTSLLLPQGSTDDDGLQSDDHVNSPDDTEDFPEHLESTAADTDDYTPGQDHDDDDDSEGDGRRGKRKRASSSEPTASVPAVKRTKPQKAISTTVPTTSARAKAAKGSRPSTAKDRFNAVAKARKEIELAKIQADAKVQVESRNAKTQEKLAKIVLAKMKLQQEHEFRMAQIQSSQHTGQNSMGSSSLFGNGGDFSFSDAGSSSSTPFGLDNDLHLPHGHF